MFDTVLAVNVCYEIYNYMQWYDLYSLTLDGEKLVKSERVWRPIYNKYWEIPKSFKGSYFSAFVSNIHNKVEELHHQYIKIESEDKNLIKFGLQRQIISLWDIHDKMTDQDDIVELAVKFDVWNFAYAGQGCRGNKSIVKQMVQQQGMLLKYASAECKNDEEICTLALKNTGSALEFVSQRIAGDRSFIKLALSNNGRSLKFAPKEFKDDPELVEMAVVQNGLALEHTDVRWRQDPRICRLAVANQIRAICHVDASIRDEILLQQFSKN